MDSLRQALTTRAREIISDPACRTQSATGCDALSRPVSPASAEARAFCGYGALRKALHERGLPDRWLVEMFNTAALTQLIRSNDSGTHTDALASLHALGSDVRRHVVYRQHLINGRICAHIKRICTQSYIGTARTGDWGAH